MSPSPSVAVMVLNWNGVEHLRALLPSLREAVAATPFPVSVVVVDNRSTGPDVEFVREEFPEFEVVVAERNDYLFSLNPVVAGRDEDIVIILNNDMRVDPHFVAPLVEHFESPDVFAATARVMTWDGRTQTTGRRQIQLRRGWLYKQWDMSPGAATYSVEAGGGSSAYRRWMFVELGGFDPVYRPGYYEDLDLSYRAWQRGWTTVFEPRSIIHHRVNASFDVHFDSRSQRRRERFEANLARNHALFTLLNVGGPSFLAWFLVMLPIRIVRNRLSGNGAIARGLMAALPMLPRALRERARRRVFRRLPDAAIAAAVRDRAPSPPSGALTTTAGMP